jgi:hypothetical protein
MQDGTLQGWNLDPRTFDEVLSVVEVECGFRYSIMPAGAIFSESYIPYASTTVNTRIEMECMTCYV